MDDVVGVEAEAEHYSAEEKDAVINEVANVDDCEDGADVAAEVAKGYYLAVSLVLVDAEDAVVAVANVEACDDGADVLAEAFAGGAAMACLDPDA